MKIKAKTYNDEQKEKKSGSLMSSSAAPPALDYSLQHFWFTGKNKPVCGSTTAVRALLHATKWNSQLTPIRKRQTYWKKLWHCCRKSMVCSYNFSIFNSSNKRRNTEMTIYYFKGQCRKWLDPETSYQRHIQDHIQTKTTEVSIATLWHLLDSSW